MAQINPRQALMHRDQTCAVPEVTDHQQSRAKKLLYAFVAVYGSARARPEDLRQPLVSEDPPEGGGRDTDHQPCEQGQPEQWRTDQHGREQKICQELERVIGRHLQQPPRPRRVLTGSQCTAAGSTPQNFVKVLVIDIEDFLQQFC
jgi:hypothetical protein